MQQMNMWETKSSKLFQNTLALFTGSILDKAAFFLLLLYFTRCMGAEIYGEYLLVFTFVSVFRILNNFGLSRLFLRDMARDTSLIEPYLANSMGMSVGLSCLFYAVLLLTVLALEYPASIVLLIVIAGLSLFPFSVALLFEGTLNAMQYMRKSATWMAVNSLLTSSVSILLLHFGYGLEEVFASLFLINTVYACGLYFALRQMNVNAKISFNISFMIDLLQKVFPFALFTIMAIVYVSMGIIILSKVGSHESIAWFGAPLRLSEVLLIIPGSLGISLFPIISKHFRQSIDVMWESYARTLRILMTVALPLGIGIATLSDMIVLTLFGKEFYPSGPVLSILIFAVVIMIINLPGTVVIFNSKYFNRFVGAFAIYLFLSLGINYLLISEYGHVGAAFSRLITESLMTLLQVLILKYALRRKTVFGQYALKPIMSSLAMVFVLYALPFIPLVFRLLIGFVIYTVSLKVMGKISQEDVTRIKNIYKKDFTLG